MTDPTPVDSANIVSATSVPANPSTVNSATVTSAKAKLSPKMKKKIIAWVTFSIMISIFPLLLNIAYAFGNNKPIVFLELFAHGELLLISVGISADAIGDLISSGNIKSVTSIIVLCCCILILLFSASWFASLGIGGSAANKQGFGISSLILFFTTLILSGICKVLAEVQDA